MSSFPSGSKKSSSPKNSGRESPDNGSKSDSSKSSSSSRKSTSRRQHSTRSVRVSSTEDIYGPLFLKNRWDVGERARKVTVFGAGSFGTAMAVMAARAGHFVTIWARNEETCASITKNHKHPLRFKNFVFPKTIRATSNMADAVANADLIIHAIPAQHTPGFLRKYRDIIPKEVIFMSTSKGILVETEQLMSEAIVEALGEGRNQPLAYLSGPSFAKEMIEGHPMAVVVASENEAVAMTVQSWMSSKAFRVYHTTDVIGVEVGGAIKNPLAIGAGMADGLGYGQSTLAALVTRGCNELMKLAVAMGGKPETLYGLSGVGDLMLTSFSTLSRNRTLGYRMAKDGLTLEQALAASGEVVEGVATAKVAAKLCLKYKLDLPLFTNLAAILEGKITPDKALDNVMNRPLKHEHSG